MRLRHSEESSLIRALDTYIFVYYTEWQNASAQDQIQVKQESRAAARKPRDAASILFG